MSSKSMLWIAIHLSPLAIGVHVPMSTFLSTSKSTLHPFFTTLYRILFPTWNGYQGQHYRRSSPKLENHFHLCLGFWPTVQQNTERRWGVVQYQIPMLLWQVLPVRLHYKSSARTTSILPKPGSGYGT
ncbi:uncharacterized protein PgNI_04725 [Pyricularia grisea]|uniref:Secreted protein n=1 Tax=Pyricularia grisea TaxID=148305 RepID=A0A6P8BBM9_PYRGI|nr:uncharacterized protein PgNI_04725 [Pyricularia grisea]TLD13235.1 hypothetical protein PgNI_04725 [Pyricularia grisea]